MDDKGLVSPESYGRLEKRILRRTNILPRFINFLFWLAQFFYSPSFRWIGPAAELALAASLALVIYLFAMGWIMTHCPLRSPYIQRIIETNLICDRLQKLSTPHVFVLGSSIVGEGIDATVIDNALDQRVLTFNLSNSGMSSREMLLLLPWILYARPAAVVIGIDVFSFSDKAITFEKLQGYKTIGSFPWLQSKIGEAELQEVLLPEEEEVFRFPAWRTLLQDRALVCFYVENKVYAGFRGLERMAGFAQQFKDPWILTHKLPPDKNTREVRTAADEVQKVVWRPENRTMRALQLLVQVLQREKIQPILVLLPKHPVLFQAAPPGYLDSLRENLRVQCSGVGEVVNWTRLLTEDEFNDSLHPNAEGRRRLSLALGKVVLERLASRCNYRPAGSPTCPAEP